MIYKIELRKVSKGIVLLLESFTVQIRGNYEETGVVLFEG